MRRHWKNLAERAAKAAFSPEQVCEALPSALRRDFPPTVVEAVRGILGGGEQGTLFPERRAEQLDAARALCRGSAAGNVLIDCAIEVVANGLQGETACHVALENAAQETARSAFRGIEEHYQREASTRSASFVRNRMDAARRQCDFGAVATDLMSSGKPPRQIIHAGLDEGPQL